MLIRRECPGARESGIESQCRLTLAAGPVASPQSIAVWGDERCRECGDSRDMLTNAFRERNRIDFGPNHGSLGGLLGTSHILIFGLSNVC